MADWPRPLLDWLGAPTHGPRRPRPLRPAITGARVINGTRDGAASTTGTGITATTGKVRQAKAVRRAGDPGDPRCGRRRSHLHRRGRRGSADVEPDCPCLGILEQRNMDSGLTKRRLSPGSWLRTNRA